MNWAIVLMFSVLLIDIKAIFTLMKYLFAMGNMKVDTFNSEITQY